jgi:tetratricopeptide (TPR) repeat protein
MKKIRLILSLFIALVSAGGVYQSHAQNAVIDSLKTLLQKLPPSPSGRAGEGLDTTRVNLMNDICKELTNTGDYENALKYAYYAIILAKKPSFSAKGETQRGLQKGIASSLNNIGDIYDYQGNYPKALENYLASLKIYEELGDKKGFARSLNNIGTIYHSQDNYPEALKNYQASLKISEELGDKKGIANSLNNIGIIYKNQGNYSEALKNYLASLKIDEELGDKNGIAHVLNNIGNIYHRQGNYPEALKNYLTSIKVMEETGDKKSVAFSLNNIGNTYSDQGNYPEALKNYLACLKISEETGDKKVIATSLYNIGIIYKNQGNYPEALKNYLASLKISEQLGDKKGIAYYLNNIGNVYTRTGKAEQGKKYILQSLELSSEIGTLEIMMNNYLFLSQADSALGKHQSALENYKQYIIYSDSMLNEENTKSTIQQQMQYEFDKKEALTQAEQDKKDALALEELEQQKMQRNGFIGGFALMLLLAGVSYRSFRNKQKANLLLAHKNSVIEEKQKEILDSINYAKRIQAAILPPERIVKKYLPDSFILYKSKDIVAGDFYWMHLYLDPSPQGEGKAVLNTGGIAEQSPLSLRRGAGGEVIFFAAADCTGHGVPGAMVSVVCNNALNRSVREYGITDPGEILDKTREIVIQEFEKSDEDVKDGMDIALCALQVQEPAPNSRGSKFKVQYAGANNPLWVIRKQNNFEPETLNFELNEVKADKQPIGKYTGPKPFTTHSIELQKGDTIYIFTDGFADQFGGEQGKKFKSANLKKLLLSIQQEPMEKQKEIISEAFEQWKGKLEQVDDVCIIGVRIY